MFPTAFNLKSTVVGCEALRTFSPRATEKDSVILINLEEHFGTIAGVVCGTLGLLLAIFIFLLLRFVKMSTQHERIHALPYGKHTLINLIFLLDNSC